jgi:NAD(P)-dependent dehydrogenase (short-subunit alcohol dehydrogenase family)
MNTEFKDKVVLITGSSSGIGEGAAIFFAESGAKVVLASRNETANQKLQKKINAIGEECSFIKTDVSNSQDVKKMIDHAVAQFGTIDIAVNSAGIEGTPLDKTAEYEESVWNEVMDVNLKGVWLSMKYEIPVMKKNGGGVIVNISSLAGLKGGDAGVAYHASKFGVVGATKAAAFEYAAENIRINAICPAVIDTPMADRAFTDPDRRANAEKMHLVGRFGKVAEVVNAIGWLSSENSAFVTGTAIPIDGGVSC